MIAAADQLQDVTDAMEAVGRKFMFNIKEGLYRYQRTQSACTCVQAHKTSEGGKASSFSHIPSPSRKGLVLIVYTYTKYYIFCKSFVHLPCQMILTTNTELSLKVTPELAELLEDYFSNVAASFFHNLQSNRQVNL